MSTSPGVTYSPDTSTTLKASAGSMRAATAATLPSAMATSRTALMRFLGSMTWPPLRSRSYFCCAGCGCAGAWPIAASARHTPAANVDFTFIVSPSSEVVPPGAPLRGQVLAHVERPRHLRGRDGAREAEAQRVAVPLGIAARELHTIPVDRPGQIARDEVALMRAFEAIADLPEMQRVRGRARDVVDAD